MTDKKKETRRTFADAAIEFREVTFSDYETRSDGGVVLRGYASVWDSPSEWLGFREVVQAGAFTRSLDSGHDVKALVEHDPSRIVARTENGSLELGEDKHGLWVRITPNDSTEGRDLVENVRTGLLTQMSIGFRVLGEVWETRDGEDFRTLTEVDIVETSIVADPAYRATEIGLADRSFGGDEAVVVAEEQPEPAPVEPPDLSTLRAQIDLLERM